MNTIITRSDFSPCEEMQMDTYPDTHLPCITQATCPKYANTTVLVNMSIHPTYMHVIEKSTCPSPDQSSEYSFHPYSRIGLFINNLPQFHNESTYFIFFIQDNQTLQYKEWVRFEYADGNRQDVYFTDSLMDYHDAMDIFNSKSRVVLFHGSHHKSVLEAVQIPTRLCYK